MGKPKRTVEEVLANDQRRRTIEDINALIAQPPPYSAQPPSEKDSSSNVGSGTTTLVPTSAFDQLDFTPSPLELPTPAECIAHLKLLHAFAKLRHEVGNKEGLYGISFDLEKYEDAKETLPAADDAAARNDSHQPEGVHGQNSTAPEMSDEAKAAATLAEGIREKRWTVFVSKAVDRFEKWWDTLPPASGYFSLPVRTSHFDASSYEQSPETFPTNGVGLKDRINSLLPPLDVLMVWHSFVLNPRVYLEDCMRLSRHKLWHTPFPWKLINESIDSETFEYSPGDKSSTAFEKSTRLQWYAENDHTNTKVLPCPRCRNSVTVPWTRVPDSPSARTITAYLTEDTGFAGKDFQDFCLKCDLVITHEKLRVAKFINDVEAVHISERPLPGTILSTRGVPQKAENSKHVGTHDPFFPNRIVEKLPEFHYNALREDMARLSIETLKHRFQGVMNTPEKVKTVNSDQYKPDLVAKDSKIAVRKVLSHYWDNSSSFSIDLVGAVIRQGGFIQKMKKIDWLHSPAAITTMQRLIVKYHRFVRIIASNPNKIAVPTLDVDLAWHTHQLNPSTYYRYSLAETKKFLNHDDKIPETSLHVNFQWTSTAYEKKYGQPYSECACWYCECTREPLRSSFTNRVFRSSKDCDVDKVNEKGLTKDPTVGVHVSSHNAVVPNGRVRESFAHQRRREFEELDLQYAKVCKRYQKKKKAEETPNRENDAYIYGAYGYPLYYPVYVPYYAEPTCEADRYTTTGGGGGGCGSCASGTCAASASMGSCAGGAGTPSCAASCGGHGDAAGGCGSCGGDGGGCGGCGG